MQSPLLPSSTALILLKTKSHPEDPYEELITSNGHKPVFLAVLEHQQVNLDQLHNAIAPVKDNNHQAKYDGLIITSQRAVEALNTMLFSLSEFVKQHILQTTKVYVVGPATRNALIKIGFASSNILGHETGHGEALAAYIISHYAEHFQLDRPPNLLFLVGETRRDIIPKSLTNNQPRIPVTELVVYETTTRDFENELRGVVDTFDVLGNKNRWMVVFSPTGTEKAINVMKERMHKEEDVEWRVVTIGPTTRDFMVKSLGIEPDAVAESPSPEGLMKVIQKFQDGRSKAGRDADYAEDGQIEIKELNYIS